MLPQQWNGWKWLAIGWFIVITILFLLPGSAIPEENWLDRMHADKIVHVGFFATLLFLWRFSFSQKSTKVVVALLSVALIYGIAIELIQGAMGKHRSSDPWDVVADMCGAVLGLYVWWWVYKKNKPL